MKIERVKIISNEEIAKNIWEMVFEAPAIAGEFKGAGQFINILAMDDWNHPLRRPMSIASSNGDNVAIIYKIFGDVTDILSHKKPGDDVELLGPLGNTFSNWNLDFFPILVGGGVGLAPILNLRNTCLDNQINHAIIIGAKNKHEHFIDHEPEQNVYLTTNDGSLGEEGMVMGPLKRLVKENNNPYIFACGPEPMLEAVQNYSVKNKVPAQLSVESYMGCGVGLCQGCVIQQRNGIMKDHSYHEKYSLVCLDGPVYEAKEIRFE